MPRRMTTRRPKAARLVSVQVVLPEESAGRVEPAAARRRRVERVGPLRQELAVTPEWAELVTLERAELQVPLNKAR